VSHEVRPILSASLVRNHGAHLGLYSRDTEDLRELEWDLLTAILLSWNALHPATENGGEGGGLSS